MRVCRSYYTGHMDNNGGVEVRERWEGLRGWAGVGEKAENCT